MPRRFFDPQTFVQDQTAVLSEQPSHHIAKVLRMQAGDTIIVFNGQGGQWLCEITAINKKTVEVLPIEFDNNNRASALTFNIFMPAIKNEPMDYAIQKATEMGAQRIYLIETEFTDVKLKAERLAKKVEHWQHVAISACEQCGLNIVPSIEPPRSLADALAQCENQLMLFGHPAHEPITAKLIQSQEVINLFIGPEGGFSDAEHALLMNHQAQPVTLGNRILRAETAVVALMASITALAH